MIIGGVAVIANLLTGCAPAANDSGEATTAPTVAVTDTPNEALQPATPRPTIPYGAEDVEGDVLVCQNVNASVNRKFDLAAENANYNDTQDVFEQFYGAGMALLYAGDGVEMTPAVSKALSGLVEAFTSAPPSTEDGVSGYWDVSRAYTDDPAGSELATKLESANSACGERVTSGSTGRRNAHHENDPVQRERDRKKDAILESQGVRLLRMPTTGSSEDQ